MVPQQYRALDFCVFLLYRLAAEWKKPVPDTFRILQSTGILNDYVFPCYDTLHTMGSQALVADVTEFARERGAAV